MKANLTIRLFLLVIVLGIGSKSWGQIAAWDFTGIGSATIASTPATTFNANLVTTANANHITRGAGAAWSTGGNSWRTVGFQNNGISTANTDYFQITLTGSAGFNLSLSTIDARFAGTASYSVAPGVSSQFAYSLDGTNFTLIGAPSVTVGTPATLTQINVAGITALQNVAAGTTVTLRYYASGQTATGGWGFNSPAAGQNGLAIGGSLTPSSAPNFIISSAFTTFSTTVGTPSAQQSYTISGLNLTPNQANGISVTAPADFEVSLTSNTFTGTNANTVTLSSNATGNIVGEPVSVYVRYLPAATGTTTANIAHIGAGVTPAQNLSVSGVSTAYFYSKAAGDLTLPATFNSKADGTGMNAVNFTDNNQTFEIRNRTTATITSNWTVSGTASKIVVGNGVDFTIPSANVVTATVDVLPTGKLFLQNTTLPVLGTLATGSLVEYAQTAAVSILNTTTDLVTYSNLKLSNSGLKTFKNATTTVTGNLTYDGATNGPLAIEAASAATFTTINLGADLTYLGTVTNPVDANSYTLITTGTGTQTITGNNNTARFFRITANSAGNSVVLSASGGTTHAVLGNASGGGLQLNTGTLFTLGGNNITFVAGTATTVSGAGTITGAATSNMIINKIGTTAFGTLNFTVAASSLNNLTVNVTSTTPTVTLGTALDLYGTITVTAGNLNLNGQAVTLKSTAANTARIADLTGGTLTGATNVTMERFIKLRSPGTGAGTGNNGRAYRLLAPTVNTTASMKFNWMNNENNTVAGTNINSAAPGYGTQITGAGGSSNGFDETANNAASIYATTNGVTPTYTAIGNTTGTLNALTGYFVYVRGDRSMDMTLPLAPNLPTSSTTLRASGTLLQGPQTAFTNAFAGGIGTKNLVTNPYPSPIDWSLVQPAGAGITASYTYWDANIGTRGGFATVTTTGVSAPATSATQFIQSGQAFFVEASGAAAPTLSIQESHKAAGNNNGVFLAPPPPVESFRAELYFTESNGFRRIADGAIAVYDNSYSAAVDASDAREINNWDENIAINRNNNHLAIESRPVIIKSDDLPIFINNMKKQAYEFEFTPQVFTNSNLKAELVDNFLNTKTLLSVTQPTVVSFTITDNPASAATDRFKVVFGAFSNPQIDAITVKASQKNNGVQVNWTSKTETDMASYEVERGTFGGNFTQVNTTTALGNSATPVDYNWFDANPNMGTNFYRVKAVDKAGNLKYSDILKVSFGTGEPGVVAYPNPMQGNSFKIDLNNMAKGIYLLNMYSDMGGLVYTGQLQHNGNPATKTIYLPVDIAKGAYQLQLSSNNGFKATQRIIKN